MAAVTATSSSLRHREESSSSSSSLASSSPATATSITFGSHSAIDQIRALTDISAITRLLHECIAHQRSLDDDLSSLLYQRPDLDRQIVSLEASSADLLSHLLSSSLHLRSSLSSTSDLADRVSSKVRELDLAQSRVHSTLARIDAIVDLGHCVDGAVKSLANQNYESAAEYVRKFLQIDARYKKDSDVDSRSQLMETKRQLESIVRKHLMVAVDQRDHQSILKFVKIFSPLGLEEEGLQIYVSYLRKVIGMRSRLGFEHLVELLDHQQKGIPSQEEPNFVGCLTNLFKDIVLAIEENDDVLRSLCGEDGIVYAICELQEECDSRGTTVLKRYMEYRTLMRIASRINSYSKNLLTVGVGVGVAPEGLDPREIELYLEEILSLTQLGEDYTEFMISKIRGLSSVEPELGPRATKAFRSGSFSRVVQDITGFYVILEEFFMVENVRKAISIDEMVSDSLTTSMVDDVFYVLQSCCRRAISTGNINSVLAVLSSAVNLLANEYQEALQEKIREPNLGAKLFLGGAAVQKMGAEIATALNNMDLSSEYVLKLRHEIEEQCAEVFPAPADREKVKSCLSEFGEMSNSFRQVLHTGMEQLVTSITPRIRPVLDGVCTISYELTESEYEEYEVNDPWVQKVLHAAEANIAWLQPTMTMNNYDSLVHLAIDFIVKRLEVIMMQKRFSPLGSLQLDRDTRALVNHFYGMTQRPVRDKFARLTQMTTILNIEKVSEILDFWGENSGTMTWRLTPAEVRRVLGLRIDFKPEAIAALKL